MERRWDSIAWSRQISMIQSYHSYFSLIYTTFPFHILSLQSIQLPITVDQLGVCSSRRPDTKQPHTVIPQSNPYSLLTN